MSEIKNDGLDQYGAEPFEQLQFGPAGVEGVNPTNTDAVLFRTPAQNDKIYTIAGVNIAGRPITF